MNEENKLELDSSIDEIRTNDDDIIDNGTHDYESELVKIEEQQANDDFVTVTNIAAEEAKTGEKVEMTEDQAVFMAAQHHTIGLKHFRDRLPKLSVKSTRRVILALLQLPELEGEMKSYLKKDDEKEAFMIGQQVLAAKYALLMNYIQEQKKAKLQSELNKQAAAQEQVQTTTEEVVQENKGETNEQQ